MKASSTLGGLAGALTLTLLNEGLKRFSKESPRLDLLGQNALAKFMKGNAFMPKTVEKVFPLAGDLVTNSLFYGLAQGKNSGNTLMRGALLGLGAGIGAVTLPKQLGLPEKHTASSSQQMFMTIGYYLIGGLVAAAVMNAVTKKPEPETKELTNGLVNAGRQAGKKVLSAV